MANHTGRQKSNAYGEELRERRERADLTQEELGRRAILSRSHIAHIEAGRRLLSVDDAERLDKALDTGGVFVRFLPDGKLAAWFEAVAELEPQAVMTASTPTPWCRGSSRPRYTHEPSSTLTFLASARTSVQRTSAHAWTAPRSLTIR